MIRINLLPFRLERKKENIRRQISIFLLSVVLVGVLLFAYAFILTGQITEIKEETKRVENQIIKYKEKARRVAQIKKDLRLLEEKLKVVESLKKQRDKQLILFDGMTELIVADRMWLQSMKTDANQVIIKGVAFDNHTIADYMRKLEASPLFTKVDLKTAKLKKFKNNVMLKEFELQCQKFKPPAPQKNEKKQGKK